MASFVQNIIWNSVEGFVEAGKRTAGGYAGDALIKAGDMIENGGRSFGDGIERKASGYGSSISGQTYQPSPKPLPSTARKPAIKRSNSSPAATGTKAIGPTSKTPLGANKYPGGGKQGLAAAKKQITSGASSAKSVAGGKAGSAYGGAQRNLTGAVGGAQKGLTGTLGGAQKGLTGGLNGASKSIGSGLGAAKSAGPKSLPKPYPNNVPYGLSATLQNTSQGANKSKQQASSGLNSAKGTAESKANNLPKPYPNNAFPSSEKKTAVRAGKPKPFNGPKKDDKEPSPYPGTNTLPGQASRTPVKKYKPMERMAPQVEKGKMEHISV